MEVNHSPHTGNGRSASCHRAVVSVTRTYLAPVCRRDGGTLRVHRQNLSTCLSLLFLLIIRRTTSRNFDGCHGF